MGHYVRFDRCALSNSPGLASIASINAHNLPLRARPYPFNIVKRPFVKRETCVNVYVRLVKRASR